TANFSAKGISLSTFTYMKERRANPRKQVDIYFNKFIEGYPYLCRCLDLSPGGALVETFAEPQAAVERFPIELRLTSEDESMWVWVRHQRTVGTRQALQFVSVSEPVRRKLEQRLAA